MNRYEWKQEQRRERLEARADHLRNEGEARVGRARSMADCIPFGQPILVGHHSEKRDRNFRAKIHNNFSKGFEAIKAAGALDARAASVGTGGISSDDPDALVKLKGELAECETTQARMIAANRIVRKFVKGDKDKGAAEIAALGIPLAAARALFEPDFCGRLGFADFETKNNGANIRRIKGRIEELTRASQRETKETLHGGVRLVENVEDNRVQLFFPGKPDASVRKTLKAAGFRWSPSAGAWQRHLNASGIWAARDILKGLTPK